MEGWQSSPLLPLGEAARLLNTQNAFQGSPVIASQAAKEESGLGCTNMYPAHASVTEELLVRTAHHLTTSLPT